MTAQPGGEGRVFRGRTLAPGYGEGRAVRLLPATVAIPTSTIVPGRVADEVARFDEALHRAGRELRALRTSVQSRAGESEAAIFDAHIAMLEDRSFAERVRRRIRDERASAERAAAEEVAALAGRLGAIADPYLRERAIDVRDIGRRISAQLVDKPIGSVAPLPEGSVVVATELLPSETLDLDRAHVVGIVTELGGTTSHVAILARALGIPAVSGVTDATNAIHPGSWLLVDGERGEVVIEPSDRRARSFGRAHAGYDRSTEVAVAGEGAACETIDGERIALRANLARASDLASLREHHLDGVGLFRTEFLFLDAHDPPSEEIQSDLYGRVLRACPGSPVAIRTLDLGGDKLPAFLAPHVDRNPSLGLRGLRFSLEERELFATQLRAIARTAAQGDVRVLFPMVMGPSDLEAAKRALEQAVAAVDERSPRIQIGAMIETPAAVFAIDDILELVDFISIGTNDLVQFTLAADRSAIDAVDECSVLHPSVLRAVARVVDAARERNRPVSVCGEAAGDPALASLLVGLGVRELSMSPARAARVRYALRGLCAKQATELASRALACRSPQEVRDRLATLAYGAPEEPPQARE